MTFSEIVEPLLRRRDLTTDQAQAMMRFLMSGDATDAQIGGVLIGLRIKGCTTDELAAFAAVLREKASTIKHTYPNLVDTCGTGGGINTFNISTAAAIVASAAGARVAKHGNRAVTSKCGSADVLEQLGVDLNGDPERLLQLLDNVGLVFMFAPAHHPAMRHVGKARKELGVRTVFNQLGPLANPANASRQLIGVYDAGLMRSMGEALNRLGTERALLVCGQDGMDEISPCGPTEFVRVWEGRVEVGTLSPEDFGLHAISPSALGQADTVEGNADILREAIGNADSPRSHVILPSVAAALWLGGVVDSLKEGVELAQTTIAAGKATDKLQELVGASREG
jgi:anthranilate phosphoribosyltransferase